MIAQRQIKIDLRYAVQALLLSIARSQWCRECNCLAEMVTIGEAAASLHSSRRAAKSGRLHYLTARDGSLLICRNSLTINQAVTEEFPVRTA